METKILQKDSIAGITEIYVELTLEKIIEREVETINDGELPLLFLTTEDRKLFYFYEGGNGYFSALLLIAQKGERLILHLQYETNDKKDFFMGDRKLLLLDVRKAEEYEDGISYLFTAPDCEMKL